MTQKAILHLSWAVIAVGAYFVGSAGKVASPDGAEFDLPTPVSVSALSPTDPGSAGARLISSASDSAVAAATGATSSSASGIGELVEQAVRSPNPIARRLAFAKLLEALTPENAMAVRDQLVELRADGDVWRDFNYSWGAMAGEEAVLFAASSEERDLSAALSGWASADPDSAIAFLDNLPEDLRGDRRGMAESVVMGLADRAPDLAADLVARLSSEGVEGGREMMGQIANRALRVSDVTDVANWSETLPDGELKGAAMARVADVYARRDPEAASRWAQRFAEQDYAADVIEEVGETWAQRDPVEAVSWLENLPEGRGQVAGLSSAFGDWEDRDPLAASQYLLSMPESEQRDSAISGFSRGYAWQDPEAAIAWAQEIADPGLREETLARAGQAYLRREPEAARAWLQASGLPPETQKRVLERR